MVIRLTESLDALIKESNRFDKVIYGVMSLD